MRTMMNSKTGDNRIKLTKLGEWFIEIVCHNRDPGISCEALSYLLEHRWRKVQGHPRCMRSINQEQSQETAITCPQVENTMRILRNVGQQHGFSFSAMRQTIRMCKIS